MMENKATGCVRQVVYLRLVGERMYGTSKNTLSGTDVRLLDWLKERGVSALRVIQVGGGVVEMILPLEIHDDLLKWLESEGLKREALR